LYFNKTNIFAHFFLLCVAVGGGGGGRGGRRRGGGKRKGNQSGSSKVKTFRLPKPKVYGKVF
jgi:hypothetical protein